MNDEIIAYIRNEPEGVPSEVIAERLLKFKTPNKALADTAVKAILQKDARVYRSDDDGLWRPRAAAPLGASEDVASTPWVTLYLVSDAARKSIAHISLWAPLPEPSCLGSIWLIDPATLSEEDREQLCDPRDDPYEVPTAVIAIEQINSALSGKVPVFFSQQQYSAFAQGAQGHGGGVDDYYLMNQLLRAAKEPEVSPLTLENAAAALLGGFRTAESAYRRGEQFCRVAAEIVGRMKAAGIESRDQLDAALYAGSSFDFTGKEITEKMIAELPLKAGVYGFTDSAGAYIYIGKAVNLRRRIESYFRANSESPQKLEKLRAAAHGLTIYLCGSELEALIYEYRLIKKHKPALNSQNAISERKGAYKELPDSVAILPHAQEGFCVSVWVKKGQKVKIRAFETDFCEEEALLKELQEYFYSGTLPASSQDFPELEIVTRWIKKNRDAVSTVNVENMGGAEEILGAMKNI